VSRRGAGSHASSSRRGGNHGGVAHREAASHRVALITRILDINQLMTVTSEVVQAARDALVIGQP
jgi:hypothetical protein